MKNKLSKKYQILEYIKNHPNTVLKNIATSTGINYNYTAVILTRLSDKNLIQKTKEYPKFMYEFFFTKKIYRGKKKHYKYKITRNGLDKLLYLKQKFQ